MKEKPVFRNHVKSLPKSLPDCRILYKWVLFYDNFILANELFAKTLQSPETCVLVILIIFDERSKVIAVPFFLILIYWDANKTILSLKCYLSDVILILY